MPAMFLRRLLVALLLVCVNAAAQDKKPFIYSLPGIPGALEIDLSKWALRQAEYKADGSGLKLGATAGDGYMMTVFLEKAKKPGTAADVRKEWWGALRKRTPFDLSDIKQFETPDSASVEYMIKKVDLVKQVPGAVQATPNQKHVHSYLAAGGLWVEVHISKMLFKSEDQGLIDETLSKVKPRPDYVATPRDNWIYAGHFYQRQDYKRAIEFYRKVFESEQQKRTLSNGLWVVMIDNLGMAYGITGDLKNARAVFQHGIDQIPQYPLFYYNMACAAGEENDLEEALKYLRLAFERKANTLSGEKMPDPMKDDSFRRFVNNPRFQQTVAELTQSASSN